MGTTRLVLGFASALALAPALACGDAEAPPSATVELASDGARVRVALQPFAVVIEDPSGKEVLRTLSGSGQGPYGGPAITRDDAPDSIKVIPGWDGYEADERPWVHLGAVELVERTGSQAAFEGAVPGGTLRVEVAVSGAKVTLRTLARPSPGTSELDAWNKTTLSFALRPDEHFFGLGERYASVDHRGLSMYAWAEEGGAGKGEDVDPRAPDSLLPNGPSMTYFPVPFFLSSEGYAVHLATTYRTETHFGSEEGDAWRVAVNDGALTTEIFVHEDPKESLDEFTRETGRPLVPATWVFGPRRRVSHDHMIGEVEEWRLLRQRGVPTTGLDDAVHFLPARSEVGREDVLRAWVENAHAFGYKVMAYNNPYVSTSIERARADLDHGKANGLFAMTPEGSIGETFFISGEPQTLATIDLTNPAGVAWFQDLLRRTLALGYDGWMHDFGEYVRRPWLFWDGRNGEAVHNEYPVLSAKAAHDLLVAEKADDFLFFVRSGYTGTQQWVPAVWGGDPEATFDVTQGLPAMLRGGLNLGLSGVPLWGSDVSGFKCLTDAPYDKEMYLRWAELGAVSPIMMEQNACANPLGRRQKWRLWDDDETVEVYGAMARLHTRLAPYFEVLAREAHRTGVPIMRHPFLYHPREPEVWLTESSFYLGGSLFASPVVRRGERVKETWLPPGRWVDLDDLTVYEGAARARIPAPLAKLPLLLREGTMVPLLDASIETLAPATDSSVVTPEQVRDKLDVLVALSPGSEARFALADGTELAARRAGGRQAPASGLAAAPPEAVASCEAGCVSATNEGMVERLRLTTPLANAYTVTHEDVTLEVQGPLARRVRWDVLRLR
jgi:sulfoquinovosidase